MKKWEAWKRELYNLEKLSLGRCIKPSNFHKMINISLHDLSDASVIGYGQCSYLQVVGENENIHCSLIMGKVRVAPKKVCIYPQARTCCCCTISENIKLDKERVNSIKNLMNISGQTAGLCWGTLLMI